EVEPYEVIPHIELSPELSRTKLRQPLTGTVVVLNPPNPVGSPAPSWPVKLEPQQYRTPDPSTPQVWISPTAICLNRNPPLTGTGVLLEFWDPSPSWPKLFAPQQSADPSERRPQLSPLPPPMLTAHTRNA